MDGTLLDENHAINDRTAQAIRQLQAKGIEFIIATGRDYLSASQLLAQQNINCAMINLNGALIHDAQGNILFQQYLNEALYTQMTDYFQAQHLHYSIYVKDAMYLFDKEGYIQSTYNFLKERADYSDITFAQFKEHLAHTKDAQHYQYSDNCPPLKLMVISNDLEQLAHTKTFLATIPNIDITSSGPNNIEITHHNAQKGAAILTYIANKNIAVDEVVTIGDSLNDRSMLEIFPNSYAMANASDTIKAIATYQAPAYDQFGVASVIEQILAQNS